MPSLANQKFWTQRLAVGTWADHPSGKDQGRSWKEYWRNLCQSMRRRCPGAFGGEHIPPDSAGRRLLLGTWITLPTVLWAEPLVGRIKSVSTSQRRPVGTFRASWPAHVVIKWNERVSGRKDPWPLDKPLENYSKAKGQKQVSSHTHSLIARDHQQLASQLVHSNKQQVSPLLSLSFFSKLTVTVKWVQLIMWKASKVL